MITKTPIQWLPVKSASSEIIPAGGLLRVTGVDAETAALIVDKPDADDQRGCLVNGLALIPPLGFGQAHLEPFAIVSYDPTDGEPAVGETWGVKADNWLARKGFSEFQITGGAGQGLVNASRYGSSASGTTVECVRVTSLSPTDGRYPGIIQDYDVEAKTWSDRTGGDCWVVGKNGSALQLKRYEDAKSRGTLAADSKPVYAVWEGLSSGSAGSSDCKSFGWLLSGPRSNKVWRVRVSEAIGQCADCTTVDPAFNGTTDRIAYHTSSPSGTQEIWEVAGNFVLCGGCATARILTNRAATTPSARAQLEVTYKSAVDGSIVTKTFDAECTPDDGTVVFAVAADDLCPDPDDGNFPCASLIRVTAECIACTIPSVACTKCLGQQGPPVFKVVASGFSDADEVYNGTWYLKNTSGCTWSVTCGGVTVSAVVDCTTQTVTFSGGGGGGGASYVYENLNGIFCFDTHSADRDTGGSLTTPESVTISAMACMSFGGLELNITASNPCGSGDYTATPMGHDINALPHIVAISGGPGDGTCPSFGMIVWRNADGTFTVIPWCNDIDGCITGDICYAGGPALTDLVNESTTPGEVLLTFDWEIDCCGTPETVGITLEGTYS